MYSFDPRDYAMYGDVTHCQLSGFGEGADGLYPGGLHDGSYPNGCDKQGCRKYNPCTAPPLDSIPSIKGLMLCGICGTPREEGCSCGNFNVVAFIIMVIAMIGIPIAAWLDKGR